MYTPRFSLCDFSLMPFLRVGLKLDRIHDMELLMLDSQLVSFHSDQNPFWALKAFYFGIFFVTRANMSNSSAGLTRGSMN